MRWLMGCLLVLGLAAASSAQAQMNRDLGPLPPGKFTYYVLALSWVPGYCANTPHADPQECTHETQGFALHGVWPQAATGYPSGCAPTPLPPAVAQHYAGLFASPGLIPHEWARHGTCTGLSPDAYFALVQQFYENVTIPPAYRVPQSLTPADTINIIAAFDGVNPDWPEGSAIVTYDAAGNVSGLELCLSQQGEPQACPQEVSTASAS